MLRHRKWVLLFGFLAILLQPTVFGTVPPAAAQGNNENVKLNIYYFWGDGCPHCAAQKPFLEELAQRYPEIALHSYEVWYVEENRGIFFNMAGKFGFEPGGVPATFLGDTYWVGFNDQVKAEIERAVQTCLQTVCPDAGAGVQGIPTDILVTDTGESNGLTPAGPEERRAILTLPFIGDIDLNQHSLLFSTAIIAFVDGFNPCSLWVLSILLAMVIHSGSRKKMLAVGLTFLVVTSAIYGLFIAGLFKVFTVIDFMGWIRVLVAFIALSFAAINIKDYFWYKDGISLTIADKHKPKIYRDFREVLKGNKSIWASIGATVVMAGGIAIIEFPCTAGFPVLWTQLVVAQNVDNLNFYLLLGLYILIYLLDELAVFAVAVVTLRASKLEEKHGRILKLVGGVLMAVLALVLLVRPDLMQSLNDSLMVFGGAFLAAGLVLLVHRKVLPRFGIYIGTEQKKPGGKEGK